MGDKRKLPYALLDRGGDERRAAISKLFALLEAAKKLQELALTYSIRDIFQDNGGKILQTLILLGLTNTGNREGNDARDSTGTEYELKTENTTLVSSFTTHHHLNHDILAKYRTVPWVFSFYRDIELIEIWAMAPDELEELFSHWESKLNGTATKGGKPLPPMAHINNPKIPFKFVKDHGTPLFTATEMVQLKAAAVTFAAAETALKAKL
jgi:hypothetical protein